VLTAVEQSAKEAVAMVEAIRTALLDVKHRIRAKHRKIYSQDLINNLFTHPYTKIELIERNLGVSRTTAAKYLDTLAAAGLLRKTQGRPFQLLHQPCARRDPDRRCDAERRTLSLGSKRTRSSRSRRSSTPLASAP
jgi:hypothetical protein